MVNRGWRTLWPGIAQQVESGRSRICRAPAPRNRTDGPAAAGKNPVAQATMRADAPPYSVSSTTKAVHTLCSSLIDRWPRTMPRSASQAASSAP